MNRCMLLAAFLFDAFRTPPAPPTVHVDFIDEAYNVTPGQFARPSLAIGIRHQRARMRGERA